MGRQLRISLANCHGIGELDASLRTDQKGCAAIYAPNGTMKTSLARTFGDLAGDVPSRDRAFPERVSVRDITWDDGSALDPESVVVVHSFDDDFAPEREVSLLLVNARLRKEYEGLQKEILEATSEFLTSVQKVAGGRLDPRDFAEVLIGDQNAFRAAILQIDPETLDADEASALAEIRFKDVFNAKVLQLLGTTEVRTALSDFLQRFSSLLDGSRFLRRSGFNLHAARNVSSALSKHGFFQADHRVVLSATDGEGAEVTDAADLDRLIADEWTRIDTDEELRAKFDKIHTAMNRNEESRTFLRVLEERPELVGELEDLQAFARKLLLAYVAVCRAEYDALVEVFRSTEARAGEIERRARKEQTLWETVIRIFNDRFDVPFRLRAQNREQVMLGAEPVLKLSFEFDDGRDEPVGLERDELLAVLSTGESRAFYILNVLFDIEVRKLNGEPTVLVVDDLADSFDYRNKYAIVEYLRELANDERFHLIVLTHNFDFFRTISSRGVVGYPGCSIATRGPAGRVALRPASNIRNPFAKDLSRGFFTDPEKRVACIPFTRNIVEYIRHPTDEDLRTLTSLLHWKPETIGITQAQLDAVFSRTFPREGQWPEPDASVADMVFSVAASTLGEDGLGLTGKVALSIAIRLHAERFLVQQLGGVSITEEIDSNQTFHLVDRYRALAGADEQVLQLLDQVLLMTSENIHLNAFMYEPIIDISASHLVALHTAVADLAVPTRS